MTNQMKQNLEPDLALYLRKAAPADADPDELASRYRRRRTMEHYDAYVVGMRLQEERKLSGLTQKEVADALGVCHQTVSMWETGKADITLRDAHRLIMLYRLIPGKRTDGHLEPSLTDITWTPMEYLSKEYRFAAALA